MNQEVRMIDSLFPRAPVPHTVIPNPRVVIPLPRPPQNIHAEWQRLVTATHRPPRGGRGRSSLWRPCRARR